MTVLSRTIRPLLLSVALIAPGAALVYTALHAPTVVTTTQRRDPVYAGMVGQWQGTVEERDDCGSCRKQRRSNLFWRWQRNEFRDCHGGVTNPASRMDHGNRQGVAMHRRRANSIVSHLRKNRLTWPSSTNTATNLK